MVLLVVTALLWYSFAALQLKLDNTPWYRILETDAKNEHAVLIYAIVASVITVSVQIDHYLNSNGHIGHCECNRLSISNTICTRSR